MSKHKSKKARKANRNYDGPRTERIRKRQSYAEDEFLSDWY